MPSKLIRRGLLALLLLAASYPLTLTALNLGLGRWLLERAVARTQAAALPGGFHVERVTVDPALRLTLDGIQAGAGTRQEPLTITCRRLVLVDWASLRRREPWAEGTLFGGQIRSKALQADGLSLAVWEPVAPDRMPAGALQAAQLVFGPLELREVTGEVWRTPGRYALQRLRGRCASGQFHGALVVETSGAHPTFAMEARVQGLALSDLARLNPTFFTGARGAGDVRLAAHSAADGAVAVTAALDVPQPGGAVQAPFLAAILPYVPAAAQTAALRRAVAQGAPIQFNTAHLQIESVTPDTIKALLLMALPEYNVVLDVDFTIHLDEAAALPRLMALWDHLVADNS